MATLIPALGSCLSHMTSGERRLAERLEQKLEDDYLLWYDVPVGPQQSHPDFVILHPRRGLLILETKDWRLETVQRATKQMWEIAPDGQTKVVKNPLPPASGWGSLNGRSYRRTSARTAFATLSRLGSLATRTPREPNRV